MGVGLDATRTGQAGGQGTQYRRRDGRRARLRDNHAAQCDDHARTARPGMVEAVCRRGTKNPGGTGQCRTRGEHVGSTSIPGIPAKPTIDILLAVRDSTDERAYVPALEAQGYRLHIRELDWHQHRLLKSGRPLVNLHVFTVGSCEISRMTTFRDRCRSHPEERALYERNSNSRLECGDTCSTTRTRRARSSKRSSRVHHPRRKTTSALPVSTLTERDRETIRRYERDRSLSHRCGSGKSDLSSARNETEFIMAPSAVGGG